MASRFAGHRSPRLPARHPGPDVLAARGSGVVVAPPFPPPYNTDPFHGARPPGRTAGLRIAWGRQPGAMVAPVLLAGGERPVRPPSGHGRPDVSERSPTELVLSPSGPAQPPAPRGPLPGSHRRRPDRAGPPDRAGRPVVARPQLRGHAGER